MARGWESKSIEDQINAREAEADASKTERKPVDCAKQSKLESLVLARTHTVNLLQATRDQRYRGLLEGTLDHLNSEIARLEATKSES